MNALTPIQPPQTTVATNSPLMPSNMAQAMQLAEMMSRGKMLPAHFHNSPGDTLMVIEQAMRWNMSPFAVAQEAASVKGRMMYSGKIVAAAVEASGAIVGYFDHKFSGKGDALEITTTATRRGETEPRPITVSLKSAMTDNVWWKKTPEQMLVYHGVRVWARRWTPGVILGVYSLDEIPDTAPYAGHTIEAEPVRQIEQHAPEPEQSQPEQRRPIMQYLRDRLTVAETEEQAMAVELDPRVRALLDAHTEDAKVLANQERAREMIAARVASLRPAPIESDPLDMDDAALGDGA